MGFSMVEPKDRILTIQCHVCHKIQQLSVRPKDYTTWVNGTHAQHAFPYLSATQRELLISKTCAQCWDALFTAEE